MLHQHDSAFFQGSPSIHHSHKIISPFPSPRHAGFYVFCPYFTQMRACMAACTHMFTETAGKHHLLEMGCFCLQRSSLASSSLLPLSYPLSFPFTLLQKLLSSGLPLSLSCHFLLKGVNRSLHRRAQSVPSSGKITRSQYVNFFCSRF